MNKQRAMEISQSPVMQHVTYNGQQIYIQHVDEQTNMARIFPLDDPRNEFDVQVANLQEHE
ncbi:MAG TPA: small acid-soluble spore protein H [Virgibacillus sp.]|nr:small acid-soluble spore protein H [Virgibacillus sp.]